MSGATQWPLVGRAQELAVIEDVVSDSGGGLVIAGAAGVGKTRLAQEALGMARAHGRAVEWLAATSASASIPFGVFAGYLPSDVNQTSQLGLFHAVTSELMAKGDGGSILLGIDDAHHLDEASAAVVHQLTVSDEAAVIATVRTGEQVPGPITSLWKEGLAARLDLQPLAEAEVADLVGRAVGGRVEGRTLRRLWEATAGNALFLHELVAGGIEAGSLREDGGVWVWDGPLAINRLHELIESRLAHLPEQERSALDRMAVAEPIRLELLERVVSPAALSGLDQRGLVQLEQSEDGAQVRVAHPLYAEAIRSALTPLRLRALHRELADAVSVGEGVDDLRVVVWCLDAEHPLPSDLLLAAARRAAGAYDHALAERLARVAESAGGGAAAVRALATAVNWQGRHSEAEATFARLDLGELTVADLVSVARSRSANLFYGLGRTDEALEVLTEAEAEIDRRAEREDDASGDATEQGARLVGMRCNILVGLGRVSELTQIAEPVLAHGEMEDRTRVQILAPTALAWACQGRGELVLSDEEHLVALERRWDAQAPRAAGWLLAARYRAHMLTGDLDAAESIVRRRYDEGAATGSPELLSGSAAALGELALLRGAATTAAGWLSEAASGFRRHDPNGLLPWVRCLTARAHALSRDSHTDVAAVLEDAEPAGAEAGLFEFERDRARAWIAAAGGEVSAAQRAAQAAADVAGANGQLAHRMLALHDAVRFGAHGSTARELAELAGGLHGELAAAIALHASATIDGVGAAFGCAADAFEAVGCLLFAAEASTAAAGAYRREGHGGQAWSERARIDTLHERLEGAQTPALLAGEKDPLTTREREVASLAAQGMSNREIADRLVVSLRTVENHLHQVYSKLDVDGRAGLTTVLGGSENQ